MAYNTTENMAYVLAVSNKQIYTENMLNKAMDGLPKSVFVIKPGSLFDGHIAASQSEPRMGHFC